MMDLDNLFGVEPDENVVDNADKIISETRNLLNEKFGDINFIEEGHRYFIDGDEYIPVSNIIKEYEQDVDWDEKAGNYAKRYGRKMFSGSGSIIISRPQYLAPGRMNLGKVIPI